MRMRLQSTFVLVQVFCLAGVVSAQEQPKPARPTRPPELPEDKSLGEGPELDGYCPVSYQLYGMAKNGNPDIKVTYQGNLYYFSSDEAKKAFEADPEGSLPAFGGWCATSLYSYGNRIMADPKVFDIFNKKVFLFSSDRARNAYYKDQVEYAKKAETRWNDPELAGRCPVTWAATGQYQAGKPEFSSVYHGLRYFLSSADAKKSFDANPAQFLGCEVFCANAAANGKKTVDGNPDVFLVHGGKVYLFENQAAKEAFAKDTAGNAAKVVENWPKLMRPTRIIRRDRYEGK